MTALTDGTVPGGAWTLAVLAGSLIALAGAGIWTQLDLDEDGLDALTELDIGTDPFRADTDGDRLPDGFELARELDPFSTDTDGDTILDRTELTTGTDPRAADTDGDTLDDPREEELGTDPASSDTDQDQVHDGLEIAFGTDPLRSDSDEDGVPDEAELTHRMDPLAPDSDEDRLPDAAEVAQGPRDCDGDGFHEAIDSDDDADHRPDAEEPPEHRCDPDVDGDGILDGDEANTACIERTDCDEDGLDDATELGTVFDRLDPDSFDVGLLDSVSWAFDQQGQPPSRDTDGDGIPDRWERTTGLIDWGPFKPAPQRSDLLVEFVRVEGPDSGRLGPGPFTSVYQDVTRFFREEGGVWFQWTQTTVRLDEEDRPPLVPSSDTAYYEQVLDQADHAGNPYVTTVVLNPQHDASEIAHQGVAPIRGMLGAIDYGAHSTVAFRAGEQTFSLTPFLESVVVADRQDILQASGYEDGGRTPEGELFVRSPSWTMTWRPFWFATPPQFTFEEGQQVNATRQNVDVDEAELADTIVHELGHTLGLCHNTLPACQANLSAEDRAKVGVSTMDPRRESPELTFLDSEWEQLRTYMACPPQRPIALIAENASQAAIIDSKYAVTLETVLDVRVRDCQDRVPLPRTLSPVTSETRYHATESWEPSQRQPVPTVYTTASEDRPPEPATRSTEASVRYALGTAVATLATAGGVGWIAHRSTAGPPEL